MAIVRKEVIIRQEQDLIGGPLSIVTSVKGINDPVEVIEMCKDCIGQAVAEIGRMRAQIQAAMIAEQAKAGMLNRQ